MKYWDSIVLVLWSLLFVPAVLGNLIPPRNTSTVKARDLPWIFPLPTPDEGTPKVGQLLCDPPGNNWNAVLSRPVWEGVVALENDPGICAPCGKQCVRMTCNSMAGIFLCNDAIYKIGMPCALVGQMAAEILLGCNPTGLVKGQQYYQGETVDWYVFVAESDCDDTSWDTIYSSTPGFTMYLLGCPEEAPQMAYRRLR